jgi:hypothetical protein
LGRGKAELSEDLSLSEMRNVELDVATVWVGLYEYIK